MDPLQVEAQLRNTFLTLLGGDMSIYEGQKQQMQQRFNNEARQVAINMVAQATNQNRAITMTDYQNVSLQLLDAYKRSTPAPQMYAGQMQQVQPMYQMGQPIQPMYQMAPMQPMVQQPLYVQPQPMMVQQQGFNSGLRYTQPVRPLYQQTAYQPMQQTIAVGDTNKNLYAGALPANAQPPQQMQMPQQTFVAPMSTVQKAVTPISIKNEAPLIQPVVSAYDMPPVTKRRVFQNKSPYTVNGEVVTYQRSDGTNIQAVVCTVTSPVADIDAFAKTLAKKEGAHDITITYTPYELISGDLKDMQNSFIAVKKIINDGFVANAVPSSIVSNIVNFCDIKTKGVAKQIERILIDAYSAYVFVANSNDDGVVIPETDDLECLQAPGSATMELNIRKALKEFEQCSIYDPASLQLSGFLKELDLGIPETFAELKKDKAKFADWAKSHCLLKKPAEIYRVTTLDYSADDITHAFGYKSDTAPDGELEFFTIEGIRKSIARKITMVIQDGKSSVTATGSVDREGDIIHVEFQ